MWGWVSAVGLGVARRGWQPELGTGRRSVEYAKEWLFRVALPQDGIVGVA